MLVVLLYFLCAQDIPTISISAETPSNEERSNAVPVEENSNSVSKIIDKFFLLPETRAKSFLKPHSRVKRGRDPEAECANAGGCEYEEIKEYFETNTATKAFLKGLTCGQNCQYADDVWCEITSNYENSNQMTYRCARDGGWGSWDAAWSECSVSCGGGTRTKTRACDDPVNMGGGSFCSGSLESSENCETTPCPVDGSWGAWDSWGACSVTCDTGTKVRQRLCDDPAPQNGGAECLGSTDDTANCTVSLPCPIDGGWETWKSWSACAPVNNYVSRTRCRKCNNPSPEHGGAMCPDTRKESDVCDIPRSHFGRKCKCPTSRMPVIKNITFEELVLLVKAIKEELKVDVSKLSKTIRKKISVQDKRTSTQAIGFLGTVLLIIPFSIIVTLDLLSVYRYYQVQKAIASIRL